MFGTVVTATTIVVGLLLLGGWAEQPQAGGSLRSPQLVVHDDSGAGNHGIKQGRPEVGVAGKKGSSYSFDAPGSWVQVPSNDSLNPGRRDFMYAAWVNFDVSPRLRESYDIIRKGLGFTPGGEYKLEIVSDGRVKCSAKDIDGRVARVIAPDADVAEDGRWHRVGCARTGRSWSVLVDGTVTTKLTALGLIDNDLPLSIGSKYGSEDMPRGLVDEVQVIVAPQEPTRKARAGVTARLEALLAQSPVGMWHLDESAAE
jgi:hypothetical protein